MNKLTACDTCVILSYLRFRLKILFVSDLMCSQAELLSRRKLSWPRLQLIWGRLFEGIPRAPLRSINFHYCGSSSHRAAWYHREFAVNQRDSELGAVSTHGPQYQERSSWKEDFNLFWLQRMSVLTCFMSMLPEPVSLMRVGPESL